MASSIAKPCNDAPEARFRLYSLDFSEIISRTEQRGLLYIVMFVGIFVQLMQRVALVAVMVGCHGIAAEYAWSNTEAAMVMSAFSYGYMLGQLPAGWATFKFGARPMYFALGLASGISLLTPLSAAGGARLMFVLRAAFGFLQSPLWVASVSLSSHWALPSERSRLVSFVLAAFFLATFTGMFLSSALVDGYGWRSVFVSFGILGLLWIPAWRLYGFSKPSEHPRISGKELALLQEAQETMESPEKGQPDKIPWRDLLSNTAVWAVIISSACCGLTSAVLLNFGMRYLHDELRFGLKYAGLVSATPELLCCGLQMLSAWLSDDMIQRGHDLTFVRKLFEVGPGSLAAMSCMALSCGSLGAWSSVILIAISMSMQGPMSVAATAGIMDMAGDYAAVVSGICNTSYCLVGASAVSLVGLILDAGRCPVAPSAGSPEAPRSCNQAWSALFLIVGASFLVQSLVYGIFASSRPLLFWASTTSSASSSSEVTDDETDFH